MNGAKVTVSRDVQGSVVRVTGADGGIGASLVAAFRKRGARVGNDVEPPALSPACQRSRAASGLPDRGVKAEEWVRDALSTLKKPVHSA